MKDLAVPTHPPIRLLAAEPGPEKVRIDRLPERAERVAVLGEIASSVVHDFNNILCVIRTYADLVAAAVETQAIAASAGDSANWNEISADVRNIQLAVTRGAELAHQMLTAADHQEDQPGPLHLDLVLAEVAGLVRRYLGAHVDLETNVAPGTWPILAAPGQLQRALLNLAVNAGDAMPEGGTLTMTAENVVGTSEDRDVVRLKVSDTGIGMSTETLRHACEPFFTTKPSGEGTGLGLASVNRIVRGASGTVRIDSEPGHGTTFRLDFPPLRAILVSVQVPRGERAASSAQMVKDAKGVTTDPVFTTPEGTSLTWRTQEGRTLARG
jgi:two-component system, cell cycle sensor histidine kinase and response regulator CckA